MFNRKIRIAMTATILCLLMFVPVAQAERDEYEAVSCHSDSNTPMQNSPGEIYVGVHDGKGIMRRTSKPYGEVTYHQVYVMKAQGGKMAWNGYIKAMPLDGDYYIWEFYGDSQSGESIMKLIYGTGKYKGAKGEQKSKRITTAKPIVQGTAQMCMAVTGWIELAK